MLHLLRFLTQPPCEQTLTWGQQIPPGASSGSRLWRAHHWRASLHRHSWRPPWCSTFHDALIVDVKVEGLHGVFLAGSGAIVGNILPRCLQGSGGSLPLGHSSWCRQDSGLQFWWHGGFVVVLVLTVALLLSASSVQSSVSPSLLLRVGDMLDETLFIAKK